MTAEPERSSGSRRGHAFERRPGVLLRGARWAVRTARAAAAQPLGGASLALVGLLLAGAILAPWLATHDPVAIDLEARFEGPSSSHWLGTDQLGRDTWSRALYGLRVALHVALSATAVALAVGLLLGLLAGLGPRWVGAPLVLLFDTVSAFPILLFALAVVTLVGPSTGTVVLLVAISYAPSYGRMARTQASALRRAEFLEAERSMGVGLPRLLLVHALPNVVGPLLIVASMDVPVVITIEAGLSFLGLGVQPPTPSAGSILADGYAYIRNTPWLVLAGALPLVLATLGFTFLGEALRDALDPRLARSRG
ncbi:MAG TPA: ABC transporter permease [Thermoanaerobaculia bacterium]|nr:ABC transporter permease [Thermoanaerobaculia bacterium]